MQHSGDLSRSEWHPLTQLGEFIRSLMPMRVLEHDITCYCLCIKALEQESEQIKSRIRDMDQKTFMNQFNDQFKDFNQFYSAQEQIMNTIDIDLDVLIPQLHPRRYRDIMITYQAFQSKRDEIVEDISQFLHTTMGILNLETIANGEGAWFIDGTSQDDDDDDDDEDE